MDTNFWQQGKTLDEFVGGMRIHKEDMQRRLQEVHLSGDEIKHFGQITAAVHVLVMTEDWCGDALLNMPILARIVEATPGMDMRVFSRKRTPVLNEHYQSRNIKNIPVFTFFDGDLVEIGTWVERSQLAHQRSDEWEAAHPELEAAKRGDGLSKQEQTLKLREVYAQKTAEMESLYRQELQAETVREIQALLAPVAQATQ